MPTKTPTKRLNPIYCDCGGKYMYYTRHMHFESKRHIRWLDNEEPTPTYNSRHVCECGGKYAYRSRKAHFKTQKHIHFFFNQQKCGSSL